MQSYLTKSEFYKNNHKYYELCRKRDLLKEFIKKDSKSSKTNYYKGIINYDDSIIKEYQGINREELEEEKKKTIELIRKRV